MTATRSPGLLRRHRSFRRLATAWLFSNIADSTLFLVLAVWVKDLTGSTSAAAFTFVCFGAPAVLAPLLGDLADRVSRRRLLIAAKVGIVPVLASLLLVADETWLPLLYAVTFLYGAVGYLTAAAQGGLVRDLLPDEDLAAGNGLLTTVDQALRLLGPLVGAGAYALAGPRPIIAVTLACFALAALVLASMRVAETPPTPKDLRGRYRSEVAAGFRHLARTPILGPALVTVVVGFAATGLLNAATFAVLEEGLGQPSSMLGVFVSVQGVGAVLGGLTAARVIGAAGEARTIAVGMALLVLGTVPLMTPWVAAALVGIATIGLGVTWCVVALVTLRQRLTPPTLQGRVGAASNVAINLPQTIVTAAGAALVGVVDYRLLLGVCVAAVAAAAVLPIAAARRRSSMVSRFSPERVDAMPG